MRRLLCLLLLALLGACSRGPDADVLRRDVEARLAEALPAGTLKLEALHRRGSQKDIKAPPGEARRIVYFDVDLRLLKDYDFGAWDSPGVAGIISALNRPVTAGGRGDQATAMDAIQTDAAINPGNSGGPLVDMNGRVIGINSAIYSPSSSSDGGRVGNIGIGFAIPIDQARRTADEIIETGKATQTYIGTMVGDAPNGGAQIVRVLQDSPAAKAGLKEGDVVVKIGDRRVEDADELVAAVRTRAPGEKVVLTLQSGRTVEVTLGAEPVPGN